MAESIYNKSLYYANTMSAIMVALRDILLLCPAETIEEYSPDIYNPAIERAKSFLRTTSTQHERSQLALEAGKLMKVCRNIVEVARE